MVKLLQNFLVLPISWCRENLSEKTFRWWAKALLVNGILFVVLFFLTTPAVVINTLDFIHLSDRIEEMVRFKIVC